MRSKIEKDDDNTNHSFLLKCMAAMGAAAIAGGILTALAITASTATTTTGLAAGAAITFSPIIPIVAIAAIIGAVCLLPLLFIGSISGGTTYVASSTPSSNYWGSYGYTPAFYAPSRSYYPPTTTTTHHHASSGGGWGGTVHTHPDSGSNVHGHGGSVFSSGPSHGGGGNVHGHR